MTEGTGETLKEKRDRLLVEGAARKAALEAGQRGGAPAPAPAPAPRVAPAVAAAAPSAESPAAPAPSAGDPDANAASASMSVAEQAEFGPPATPEELGLSEEAISPPRRRLTPKLALLRLSVLGLVGGGTVILLLFAATLFFPVPVPVANTVYLSCFAVIGGCSAIAFFVAR